jgi:protein O-GlcNAc transferase
MSKTATRSSAPRASAPSQNAQIRAIELQNKGMDAEAIAAFRKILAGNPNEPVALYSLAALMMKARATDEALTLVERGVVAAPLFAPMWFARGTVMQALGRREEALRSYDEALKIKPDYTEALINSGALMRDMHRHKDALERFNQVLQFDPNHTSALGNCGILLTEFKRSDQAIGMFERLLALNPDYPYGPGLLAYERLHICDWTGHDALSAQIVAGVRAGKQVCKTLGLMALSDQAEDHFLAAKIFAAQWFPAAAQKLWRGERYGHQRLRVAYVSPDLREHPVGHLMAGVFERHDKARFETFAISVGVDDGSRLRDRMKNCFDHFIDMRGEGSRQIAELMREHEIDIAIDLAGYTSDTRVDVFAHRPAPLQITYLGYPGTLGTEHFDYILADRHVIPPEHHRFYTEKVAYLPDTYLPTDAGIQIAERTPTRAECGLPETGPVLCSFSHDYKLNPALFASWMRILKQIDGSVLWLVSRNEFSQANLRREAQAHGIDPARLVFAARVPRVEDHLARYRLADLFLDTTPYNAHTTAADALMAGLPVVTCMGNAFPARVAASLLHAIGLPELVTHSMADYEALAVALVADRPRLAALKAKLLANQKTHALFDTERFCHNMEATLLQLHAEHLASDAPPQPAAAAALPAAATAVARRLHIGGKVRKPGWEVLNAQPGPDVDHLGNANDLSRFDSDSFDVIYASHVVEHFDYRDELHSTLSEWFRVLKPGGQIQISVPDLEVLAGLLLNKQLAMIDRFMVMRMIFGGHMDEYDYHLVGLTDEILGGFLANAGFVDAHRVERFGHFKDTSDMSFAGQRISLNVQARKPLL